MSPIEVQKMVNNNENWADVRSRFLTNFPPSFHTDKEVELLNLCRASKQLRQLIPFISLGRLGLWRYDAYERGLADDFVCLYYYDFQYVASDISNDKKRFFDTSEAVITFVKQHINDENPFQ
ncbi:hypothetical protein ACFQ48_09655 [Hymenobacter caeli]|uniref:Uncharacterized protein n=1 Tax=Hymenobacter caeli TaxID=2735894 RepID=A0ABX2FN16_9BACT|nr:hypothetical protein [Hymenobacter caeli]NRT18337.1 hypothetical protein [Hymenobacter caeli]